MEHLGTRRFLLKGSFKGGIGIDIDVDIDIDLEGLVSQLSSGLYGTSYGWLWWLIRDTNWT